MPGFTKEVYTSMGVNDFEYELMTKLLGRDPSYTELGMFAVMWSEHCGYKYSRPVLAYFKQYKEAMEGAGLENAGVIDIGDGLGITMKVESHNHPSAVEPYQGAATGVGGIIRDILTMGARPIALLNSLRFGPIVSEDPSDKTVTRNRFLFEHVVAGIAGYGNCVGVPTVAGEINFHPRYSGNPLVNAMCVGLLSLDKVTTAAAKGVGNPVIYLGSATGKDGIHGATFASDALDEQSESKRPNVQIGDPFAEKLLIEATLEALDTGAIVSIQDMGAAGLTCSTVEMASKGGVGMIVDLDKVPMRESDMTGYELMLSESQERMMAVAELGREQEVIDVFKKWGLYAVVVGFVTAEPRLIVKRLGEVIADLDPTLLTDHCPVYYSDKTVPAYFEAAASFDPASLPRVESNQALLKLLAFPDITSKRWVYQQYDQQVQTQTAIVAGVADAAVVAPRGTKKGIALKIDGNGRWVYAHPYRGGKLAIAESARNVACTGAKPVAATDGLNFGNPQHPHVYWQFDQAVLGIAEAAEEMGTPVVSGNVSFYNESEIGEVLPTPLIGMLGVLDSAEDALKSFPSEPCQIGLLSINQPVSAHEGLGASAFLTCIHGQENGYPEATDTKLEKVLCQTLHELAKQKAISFAHDFSDGGFAVCAAEVAISSPFGMKLQLPLKIKGLSEPLFSELPGFVLVGIRDLDKIQSVSGLNGINFEVLGETTEDQELLIGTTIALTKLELKNEFERAISRVMARG